MVVYHCGYYVLSVDSRVIFFGRGSKLERGTDFSLGGDSFSMDNFEHLGLLPKKRLDSKGFAISRTRNEIREAAQARGANVVAEYVGRSNRGSVGHSFVLLKMPLSIAADIEKRHNGLPYEHF